jgi:hypothetical protein
MNIMLPINYLGELAAAVAASVLPSSDDTVTEI